MRHMAAVNVVDRNLVEAGRRAKERMQRRSLKEQEYENLVKVTTPPRTISHSLLAARKVASFGWTWLTVHFLVGRLGSPIDFVY